MRPKLERTVCSTRITWNSVIPSVWSLKQMIEFFLALLLVLEVLESHVSDVYRQELSLSPSQTCCCAWERRIQQNSRALKDWYWPLWCVKLSMLRCSVHVIHIANNSSRARVISLVCEVWSKGGSVKQVINLFKRAYHWVVKKESLITSV